ncbi:MAG: hypothetical protein JWR16_320 [Nevskia sp.]|nr:hypothetical protein [Nevskia sp.]
MPRKICRRWTDSVRGFLLIAALAPFAAAHAGDWPAPLDSAIVQAQTRHAPLLLDFHAPWCYSCYYMAHNVFNGSEWAALERRAVVVEIDVDAPEGAYWKDRLHVQGLPSYVVLNVQGAEQGRIVGEQTRADFYRQLEPMLARDDSFEALREDVHGGGHQSLKAARKLLQAYYARGDADGALSWLDSLPAATRSALQADTKTHLAIARVQLLRAAQTQDAQQCASLAPAVLAGELGCERAYELDRVMQCTAALPIEQRRTLLAPQKPAMAHLLTSAVFAESTPSCADVRSEILTAAELDETLGYPHAAAALLDRAIDDTQRRLAVSTGRSHTLDLKKDRNLADNLRAFLDHAGKTQTLDALYPQLIEAYPDDYVYPYRFAKSLAARAHYAEALPYLERALPKAYGVNRLDVAALEASTLVKLNRADEARKLVAETLKANGPWFPEKAAALKASLTSN